MIDVWEVDEWKEKSAVYGAKRSSADIVALDKLLEEYHKTKGREFEKRIGLLGKIIATGVKFVGEKLDVSKVLNPQAYLRIPAVQQLVAQASAKSGYYDECIEVEEKFPYVLMPLKKAIAPRDGKWQPEWQKKIDKVNAELSNLVNFRDWVNPARLPGKMLDKTYWTEAIDPLHRNLQGDQSTLYKEWNRLRADDKKPIDISFHRWLEEQDPALVAKLQSTQYKDAAGREPFRIWARAIGQLWRCDDGVWDKYDTSEYETNFHGGGWAIFVIGAEDEELYSHNHNSSSKFFHATFMGGRPVLGAGEIQVRNGVLWRMSPKSGHYKPGIKEICAALEWFKARNIPLDKGFEVSLPGAPWPNPVNDEQRKVNLKIQEWYNAAWFLSQKGKVDSKECELVTDGKPLKPEQVRIMMLQRSSFIWTGKDWLGDLDVFDDPWLKAARALHK